jgi:hypothetical protein
MLEGFKVVDWRDIVVLEGSCGPIDEGCVFFFVL